MIPVAVDIAEWAHGFSPRDIDSALAERSLVDTIAVTLAARTDPMRPLTDCLSDVARWATLGHVLDFDDLHIPSTAHISVVIVPTVLAAGGDARAYLAGAGVMARLGTLLGWRHYAAGWHATCTAGAPAAAIAAGVAWGLSPAQLANAVALAVPAAGGVQTAFGTHGKALQVGFAAEAGMRAARLARAGARADPRALDDWLDLVGAERGPVDWDGPAVPGGLAVKLYPCCYALQRPIAAVRTVRDRLVGQVARVALTTPLATVQPLIHDHPDTGLEGKFSLPYSVATAVLDDYPGLASFTDEAVRRPEARRLVSIVETELTPGGCGLLDGEVDIRLELADGGVVHTSLDQPPGSPERAPDGDDLAGKFHACGPDVPELLDGITWESAADLLRATFPSGRADA
jgi:2-methylcitrate dehydratase PrpD